MTTLRLTPRHIGRTIDVMIRIGEKPKTMRTCGVLTMTIADYRTFITLCKQGSAMMSPGLALEIDLLQTPQR